MLILASGLTMIVESLYLNQLNTRYWMKIILRTITQSHAKEKRINKKQSQSNYKEKKHKYFSFKVILFFKPRKA